MKLKYMICLALALCLVLGGCAAGNAGGGNTSHLIPTLALPNRFNGSRIGFSASQPV